MKSKFKVGDVIKGGTYQDNEYKVVEIIFNEEEVSSKYGCSFLTLKDNYILYSTIHDQYYFLDFNEENLYSIINSSTTEIKSISLSCPQCNSELVDKFSEYVGGTIKKCKSCGWC